MDKFLLLDLNFAELVLSLKPSLSYVKNFSIQTCLQTMKHTARVNLHPVYPGHVYEGHPDGHGHHRVGLVVGVESDTGS